MMGLFNETEEEKNYKKLMRAIKSAYMRDDNREFLINYVEKINNGEKNNPFFEFDYLNRAILGTLDSDKDFESLFRQYEAVLRLLLPEGMRTEEYPSIMEMFLNNFCGSKGFIENDIFDKSFYALFDNRYDYLYIMNIIKQDTTLYYLNSLIFEYAIMVSPFCSNAQIFKNELLHFMNGLHYEIGDCNSYKQQMLTEAKKRVGVYPLDEKTLALLSAETEKAQESIVKLEAMKKSIDAYQERIEAIMASSEKQIAFTLGQGKQEITNYSESSVSEMKTYLAKLKTSLLEELDQYLVSLEESMKKNSDQVFQSVLEDAKVKIREIKVMAQGLSSTTTSELLRIQNATEESVEQLKSYVENNPQLKELLKGAKEDDQLREALLKIKTVSMASKGSMEKQDTSESVPVISKEVVQPSGIIIPGYDRIVTPANPSIVIPEKGVIPTILPSFDESIAFDKRMKRILDEKLKREESGEFFHDMTEEIIRCVLEGDWCYLWGPSGCGKSYTIKQVAELIGIDMVDNGKITDKYSIMAYNDPHGRFRATQAFVAAYYGKLLLLDEFDNGNTDTQVVLNELYSGLLDVLEKPSKPRYITFAEDMTIPIHCNFRMISAGNTSGGGENEAFSSRGKIDESVQQRMTPKKFWYDNRVEKRVFGDYENWYNIFVKFREVCDTYAKHEGFDTPIGVVTTRDATAIVKYIEHNSKSVSQVLAEKFVQTKSEDYLQFIKNQFQQMYQIEDVPRSLSNPRELSKIREKEIAKHLIFQCSRSGR